MAPTPRAGKDGVWSGCIVDNGGVRRDYTVVNPHVHSWPPATTTFTWASIRPAPVIPAPPAAHSGEQIPRPSSAEGDAWLMIVGGARPRRRAHPAAMLRTSSWEYLGPLARGARRNRPHWNARSSSRSTGSMSSSAAVPLQRNLYMNGDFQGPPVRARK